MYVYNVSSASISSTFQNTQYLHYYQKHAICQAAFYINLPLNILFFQTECVLQLIFFPKNL